MPSRDGELVDAGTETNANLYHELYYHFLGTDQSQDILCWRDPENPKYMFGGTVTEDGKVPFCYFDAVLFKVLVISISLMLHCLGLTIHFFFFYKCISYYRGIFLLLLYSNWTFLVIS